MKMNFQLTLLAALAAGAFAAPAPSADDTTYRLPSTVVYLATVADGTIIGSLKGDGNFTTKRIDFPFRSYYTTGNNGNDANISGYNKCSVGSGPLQGAQLNCSTIADQTTLGQFWDSDGYLSVDGPTGIAFSIDSLPATDDSVGVPTYLGGSGAWGQFRLQAKSASG